MAVDRRTVVAGLGAAIAAPASAAHPRRESVASHRPLNIVLIVADDLGWGDLGCMGSPFIKTPNVDRLAREGVRLTDFYASANVCTPSRAGMITGRYPIRTGLAHEVITVKDQRGLPLSEVTIPEMLRPRYATMLAGKWHLGHFAPSWPPMVHGFDRFAGIPYSNDMRPLEFYRSRPDGSLAHESAVQDQLTTQIFGAGIAFVKEPRKRPFFLMLTPSAPHVPLRPSAAFKGHSDGATYGDVVEELDAAVGRLMAALEAAGHGRDTLVLFTSDNGPWFEGSTGAHQGRKGGAGWDGGYLVPMIAWMPGQLKPRVTGAIGMNIDLLPTIAAFAGAALPPDVTLDGRDLSQCWRSGAATPHETLLLFNNERVAALRTQQWKFVGRSYYRKYNVPLASLGYPLLFDVSRDPGETISLVSRHPDVAADLGRRFAAARAAFEPLGRQQVPDTIPSAS